MKRFDSAYILAGGQSSRFGANKALVSVFGEPLIVRVARQLVSEGVRVTLVVQNEADYTELADYSELGIRMIEDGVSNAGPLAGVLAALRDSHQLGAEWCLIGTCDMLDWPSEWRAALVSAIRSRPDSIAVVLSDGTADEFRPFPGLYRSLLHEFGTALWSDGVRSMREFHRRLPGTIEKCGVKPDLLPKSFNTREELLRLLAKKS